MEPTASRSTSEVKELYKNALQSFEPFTPQFSPLPESLLPNASLRYGDANLEEEEQSDASSDSETVKLAEPSRKRWHRYNEEVSPKQTTDPPLDLFFYYDQRFFENLEFIGL